MKRLFLALCALFSLQTIFGSTAGPVLDHGPVFRAGGKSGTFLETGHYNTTTFADISKMIQKYAVGLSGIPVKDIQSGAYNNILTDRYLMSEYLFAQVGTHMGLSVAPGADITAPNEHGQVDKSQMVTDPFGLKSPVGLVDMCERSLRANRYARAVTEGVPSQIEVDHLDLFAGIIIVNAGSYKDSNGSWRGLIPQIDQLKKESTEGVLADFSSEMIKGTANVDKKGNISVNVLYGGVDDFVDQWNNKGSLFASGRQWGEATNIARGLVFRLLKNDGSNVGSEVNMLNESATGSEHGVFVKKADSGSYPAIALQKGPQILQEVVQDSNVTKFFDSSTTIPWAVIVEVFNVTDQCEMEADGKTCKKDASGNEIMVNSNDIVNGTGILPSVSIVGLARLNPIDFPVTYKGNNSPSQTGLSDLPEGFSVDQLVNVPSNLYASVSKLAPTPQSKTLSYNIPIASPCKAGDTPVNLSGKIDNVTPLNFAQAKFAGVLSQRFLNSTAKLSVDSSGNVNLGKDTLYAAFQRNLQLMKFMYVKKSLFDVPSSAGYKDAPVYPSLFYILQKGPGSKVLNSNYITATDNYVPIALVDVQSPESAS